MIQMGDSDRDYKIAQLRCKLYCFYCSLVSTHSTLIRDMTTVVADCADLSSTGHWAAVA